MKTKISGILIPLMLFSCSSIGDNAALIEGNIHEFITQRTVDNCHLKIQYVSNNFLVFDSNVSDAFSQSFTVPKKETQHRVKIECLVKELNTWKTIYESIHVLGGRKTYLRISPTEEE